MIVRKIYLYHILLIILVIVFSFSGCIKPDISPRLEIRVSNESGDAVEGAYVSLYENIDEWGMHNNPVQVWKETDVEGKVLFIGLSEIVYYFYILKDNMDNSDSYIKLEEALSESKIMIINVIIK